MAMGRHSNTNDNNAAIKATLLTAANELALHGWCQGRGYEDGKRCVTNAIGTTAMEVTGNGGEWLELADAATTLVAETVGVTPLQRWNDHPDRTADEVIETLRRVALQL